MNENINSPAERDFEWIMQWFGALMLRRYIHYHQTRRKGALLLLVSQLASFTGQVSALSSSLFQLDGEWEEASPATEIALRELVQSCADVACLAMLLAEVAQLELRGVRAEREAADK